MFWFRQALSVVRLDVAQTSKVQCASVEIVTQHTALGKDNRFFLIIGLSTYKNEAV